MTPVSMLRLMQLCSPALPVGTFAYSQGMEYAVHRAWIRDEASAADWIIGIMNTGLARLDVPILARAHRAWSSGDIGAVSHWNNYLLASRESRELLQEDETVGTALLRLLRDLGCAGDHDWPRRRPIAYAVAYALAAHRFHIDADQASMGLLWSWAENQVAAAIKLVPLGQTSGQRILGGVINAIPYAVRIGLAVDDADVGATMQGLAAASALHESQHTRLFRS